MNKEGIPLLLIKSDSLIYDFLSSSKPIRLKMMRFYEVKFSNQKCKNTLILVFVGLCYDAVPACIYYCWLFVVVVLLVILFACDVCIKYGVFVFV